VGDIIRCGSAPPRSSLSVLVHAMEAVIENSLVPSHPVVPEPVGQPRRITSGEEAAILARADGLNARIARILEEYG
jgi:hypothetical protein